MPAWRPLAFTVEAMVGINSLHVADSKAALSAPPNSKNDPEAGKSGNSGRFLFSSLFLLCYLLSRKLSKPMIYLSDFQLEPHRPPCFYWKYPCFLLKCTLRVRHEN